MQKLVQRMVHRTKSSKDRDSTTDESRSTGSGPNASIYKPFAHNNEIRLAKIKYNDSTQRMSVRLIHVSLAEVPIYRAISYAWGDATDRVHIDCNNGSLEITANLFSALRRAKVYSGSTWLFWADAICINQEDVEERNQQILFMSTIFQKANAVLADLGEESDDSELAIENISKLQAAQKCWSTKSSAAFNEHLRTKLPPKGDKAWEALRSLLSRPWFTRIWVVQEVVLGKQVRAICGKQSFDFKTLRAIVHGEREKQSLIYSLPQFEVQGAVRIALRQIWLMDNEIGKNKKGDSSHLSTLIEYCEPASVTDPRDRIFAILGLAKQPSDQGFVADYKKSAQAVFVEFSRFIGTPLPPARLVGWPPPSDMPPGLPSWALRLNLRPDSGTISGSSRPLSLATASALTPQTDEILTIDASPFDVIRDASPTMRSTCSTPGEVYGLLRGMIDRLDFYPTGENLEEVLLKAVLPRHISEDTCPTLGDYRKSYAAFRHLLDVGNKGPLTSPGPETSAYKMDALIFRERLKYVGQAGRVCITRKGYLGIVSSNVEKDDLVFMYQDAQSTRRRPLILRKYGAHHLLVDSYTGLLRREFLKPESSLALLPDKMISLI